MKQSSRDLYFFHLYLPFGAPDERCVLLSFVLAAATLLTGCHRKEAAAGKGKRQQGPVPVLVGKAVQYTCRCKCGRLEM